MFKTIGLICIAFLGLGMPKMMAQDAHIVVLDLYKINQGRTQILDSLQAYIDVWPDETPVLMLYFSSRTLFSSGKKEIAEAIVRMRDAEMYQPSPISLSDSLFVKQLALYASTYSKPSIDVFTSCENYSKNYFSDLLNQIQLLLENDLSQSAITKSTFWLFQPSEDCVKNLDKRAEYFQLYTLKIIR